MWKNRRWENLQHSSKSITWYRKRKIWWISYQRSCPRASTVQIRLVTFLVLLSFLTRGMSKCINLINFLKLWFDIPLKLFPILFQNYAFLQFLYIYIHKETYTAKQNSQIQKKITVDFLTLNFILILSLLPGTDTEKENCRIYTQWW